MAYERSIYSDMYSPNNMFGVTNTNAANNLNNQTAKVYDKNALTGAGANWAGYGFGANDELEAMENYFQEAQGLRQGKLGKGKTPGQLRTWMERQQNIPFGGGLKKRDINMDLVPKDFLINEQDFRDQKSPYSLFGKDDQTSINNLGDNRYVDAGNVMNDASNFNIFGMSRANADIPTEAERFALERSGNMQGHPNMRDISGEVGEYGNTSGFDLSNMNLDDTSGAHMRLKGEPFFGNYQKFPKGDQWRNKDKYLNELNNTGTKKNFPGILGMMQNMFQRSPQKQAAYDAIMGSQDDRGVGTYKGNRYQIADDPRSGLKKVYSELNPYGKNLDSFGGSKSLEQMDQEKVDWALGRLAKFKDKKGLGISKRLLDVLINKGIVDKHGGKITGGGKTITGDTYKGPKTFKFDPSITGTKSFHPSQGNVITSGYQGKQGSHHLNTGGYLRSRYNRGGRVGILSVF